MTATLPREETATSKPRRFAFLIKPGWIGGIVGAIAFAAACWLILAPWQFGRSAQNNSTNASVDAALHSTAVPVGQYLSTTAQPAPESTYKLASATGTFDPEHTFYVRLRQDSGGNPVSEVVLPMRLTDGSILLVDRGYQSFGDINAKVPLPPVPTGIVTVTGRVQADQTDPSNRQPKFEAGLFQAWAVNADALAGMDGTVGPSGNVLLGYIQLVVPSPGVLQEIGMPQTSVGPYFSYALQWCAFGAMALLAIGYFIFREATDPRGPDERDVAYPERSRYPDEIAEASVPLETEPRTRHPATGPPDENQTPNAARPVAVPPVVAQPHDEPRTASDRRARPKRKARDGFDRSQLFD